MSLTDMILPIKIPLASSLPLLALLLTSAASAATTVTLRPDGTGSANADALITTGPTSNLTGKNYGAAGALAVSASSLANGAFDSLLRFDVSTAKSTFDSTYGVGGWSIDGVTLQLTTSTVSNAMFNANATGSVAVSWLPTDAWTEGTGNPNTPASSGVSWNDLASLLFAAESQSSFAVTNVGDGVTANYALTPSSGLLSDVAAGTQVSLLLSSADSSVSALFNSRNFGTASRRPALILSASGVPEPGRAWLLLLGLAAVVQQRRRK